jgi:CheY-like chemotaxis protein
MKGYTTMTAYNGKDGLDTALREHPDLITLDVRMPIMDGYEVMRELRKDAWGKDAKILILTATGGSEPIPDDLTIPQSDFLAKTLYGMDNIAEKVAEKLAEGNPALVQTVPAT